MTTTGGENGGDMQHLRLEHLRDAHRRLALLPPISSADNGGESVAHTSKQTVHHVNWFGAMTIPADSRRCRFLIDRLAGIGTVG